jgi:hypothetical protein
VKTWETFEQLLKEKRPEKGTGKFDNILGTMHCPLQPKLTRKASSFSRKKTLMLR